MSEARTSRRAVSGSQIGYLVRCHRQLWWSLSGIRMEPTSDLVRLGEALDRRKHRGRDENILIRTRAPDGSPLAGMIDGASLKEGVLHEVKRSRTPRDAHRWQLRFYLWLLELQGVEAPGGGSYRGRLHYPRVRKVEPVTLEEEHRVRLGEMVGAVQALAEETTPPPLQPNRSYCDGCSFFDLCYG